MKGSYRKRGCKCPKDQRCKCGATWSFRINGTDPKTGKRIQPEFHGYATKAEAETACAGKITQINNGGYVAESSLLFKEFVETWLNIYKSDGHVKNSSIRVRDYQSRTLLKYFAASKMKNITSKMYQDALLEMKKDGHSHNTLVGTHGAAKMIFKKAMEMRVIQSDPTEFSRVPRSRQTLEEIEKSEELPKYLEKEELKKFLEVAKKKGLDCDYALFYTLAYTGLRIGEAIVLKWSDIDTTNSTISVTKTLDNPDDRKDYYELTPPKTKASKRIVEVDESVLAVLEQHRVQQNIKKMKYRKTYHDKDFIFARLKEDCPGYPVIRGIVEKHMKRLLILASLNAMLTPHSLRHTHTSLLSEAGADIEAIMSRLGHKNDTATRLIYNHVTKTLRKETAKKFSDLMNSIK